MPFKKNSFRKKLEAQLDELTDQAEDLRQQVVDRAPGVRDQILDRLPDRDELTEILPDKRQLLDLRADLFDRLPDVVTDKLPEKVKPKRSRLKRVAMFGVVTGAGAAAFAAFRRQSGTPAPAAPFPQPPRPTGTDAAEPSQGTRSAPSSEGAASAGGEQGTRSEQGRRRRTASEETPPTKKA